MEYFKKNGVILGPAIAANAGLLLPLIEYVTERVNLKVVWPFPNLK